MTEQAVRNDRPSPPKLVSFDLDGTLFPGTTTCLELGRHLGHLELIRDLEARYARSEISNTEVATQDAFAYRGRAVSEMEHLVRQIPLIDGFRSTITALKAQNIRILIVTVTWSFAASTLVRDFNLDGYAGADMGESDGRLTGLVERHFEEHHKPLFVREYAEKLGFDLSQCAAVGDSRSDIPLFKEVGFAIALNATEQAKEAAHLSLATNDLTDVLPHLLPSEVRKTSNPEHHTPLR